MFVIKNNIGQYVCYATDCESCAFTSCFEFALFLNSLSVAQDIVDKLFVDGYKDLKIYKVCLKEVN